MNEESNGYPEYEAEWELYSDVDYWNEKFAADIIAGRNVIIRNTGISVSNS